MEGEGEEKWSKRATEARRYGWKRLHTLDQKRQLGPILFGLPDSTSPFFPFMVGIAPQPRSFLLCQQRTLPWSVGEGHGLWPWNSLKHLIGVEPRGLKGGGEGVEEASMFAAFCKALCHLRTQSS